MKQGLKRLFLLLLGQCYNALEYNLRNMIEFTNPKDKESILELLNVIEEEGYSLLRNDQPPVLYHCYCLNFYRHKQGNYG